MWKKEEIMPDYTTPNQDRTAQPGMSSSQPDAMAQRATVGRSIVFRGDLSGEEDLIIQGRVEGSVNLGQHSVTIGPDGEVIASIVGRVVTVEGRVEGNIDGAEQVTLKSSSYVKGDITAPRVVLENGARFRGLVDMGENEDAGTWSRGATNGQAAKPAANGKSQKDAAVTPRIGDTTTNGALETAGASGGKGGRSGDVGSQVA
jgi:cytoskeletal protein CcmA (bactofilin family)